MDTQTILAAIARHAITTIAGILVAHGYLQSSGTEGFIGACMVILGVAWSWWQKSGQQQVADELARLKAYNAAKAANAYKAAKAASASPIASGPVKAAVALLALGLTGALLWPGAGQAQTPRPRPTGNPIVDIGNAIKGQQTQDVTNAVEEFLAKPFQDLATFIGDDSVAAIALSTAVPELQDGHGQQCWMAMKQFGEVAKAHPVPLTLKIQTDVEAFRLLGMAANNLCANPHCTQVFADMANAVQTMAPVNASIPIPSLHDLCAKVPQVAVVPALPATATPAPSTPAAQ